MTNTSTVSQENNLPGNITGRDVADLAQVSVGTVFRVLSNRPNVDPRLRERVLGAMQQLGYVYAPRPKKTPARLNSNNPAKNSMVKTLMVCAKISRAELAQNAYFYEVLQGAEAECSNQGIGLLHTKVEDDLNALEAAKLTIQRNRPDGVILFNYGSRELVKNLLDLGTPFIVIDPRNPLGLQLDAVLTDVFEGTFLAIQRLIELGHRDIAFFNGPARYVTQRRLDGYRYALMQANIPYRPELVVSTTLSKEGGSAAVEQLLASGIKFTGLHCADDYVAFGAVQALNAAGYKVPDDFSVIGFNDSSIATLCAPALTSVNVGLGIKGHLAVRQVISRISQPSEQVVHQVIPAQLTERASTKVLNPKGK
jgi:LacI family transcriptional regulator